MINSEVWLKTRSRFCIGFQESKRRFDDIMTLLLRRVSTMRIRIQDSVCLQPLGFRIRILKSRSGFGLIKQGLSHVDHRSQVFWRSIGMCVMFSATSCPSVNHATIVTPLTE